MTPTRRAACGVVAVRPHPGALPRIPDAARPDLLPSAEELVATALRTGATAALAGEVDENGLLVAVETALQHLARAHRAGGFPVTVRTAPRLTTGLDVAGVVDRERIDPAAVLLTGCGAARDPDHLAELGACGFRLGVECSPDDERAADLVAELCRRGLADRVVLLDGRGTGARTRRDPVERALRRRGVSDGGVAAVLGGTVSTWAARRWRPTGAGGGVSIPSPE